MEFHLHFLNQACRLELEREGMFYFMVCFKNEVFSCLNDFINLYLNYLMEIIASL
jgi:hypothetical protein